MSQEQNQIKAALAIANYIAAREAGSEPIAIDFVDVSAIHKRLRPVFFTASDVHVFWHEYLEPLRGPALVCGYSVLQKSWFVIYIDRRPNAGGAA